jgi:branched-chain amino acid transport system ATP-binding protein
VRLELKGISAGYGSVIALREVDLVVPSGASVALLGPNGAGKTTLLRVASGMVRPQRGRIRIDSVDVTGDTADAIAQRGICHVTEGRSVFPGLTVKENLRLFAPSQGAGSTIDRVVEAFPILGRRMTQIAGTMSGGEQQMLALARAYLTEARVVLLDELSMGLAPVIVDEIFEHLRQLADAGTTLLLVEQYAAKALALVDLVYLLVRGRIVLAAEPAEIAGTDIFARYLGESDLYQPAGGV